MASNQTLSGLREEVNRTGNEVRNLADRINGRLHEYRDWHRMVEERPLTSFAVSVGVGLALSGVLAPMLRLAARQAGMALQTSLIAALVAGLKGQEDKMLSRQ